jgi:hypothetical protein
MTEFTIYLDAYEDVQYDLDVEVATDPATDPDGTLADADVIDRYEAVPKPAFPDIFAARTRLDARWPATPGRYYWQAHYEDGADVFAGPVRSLRIVPAPPPDAATDPAAPEPQAAAPAAPAAGPRPLAASTARIVVRRAIVAATHRYRAACSPVRDRARRRHLPAVVARHALPLPRDAPDHRHRARDRRRLHGHALVRPALRARLLLDGDRLTASELARSRCRSGARGSSSG